MVAEGDAWRAGLALDSREHAPTQSGTQLAHRRAFGDHPLDDAVRILLGDAKGNTAAGKVSGQHISRKAGLLLIEIDGDELERPGRALLQRQQYVEEAITVLATRHADHNAIVRIDHRVVGDRLADLTTQPLAQFGEFEFGLARIASRRCAVRMMRRANGGIGHPPIVLAGIRQGSGVTPVSCGRGSLAVEGRSETDGVGARGAVRSFAVSRVRSKTSPLRTRVAMTGGSLLASGACVIGTLGVCAAPA